MFVRLLIEIILISCLISFALSTLRWIAGALFGGSAGSRKSPVRRAAEPIDPSANSVQRLVKDPVCGVYIPESAAIRAGAHFYCSEECRRNHRL